MKLTVKDAPVTVILLGITIIVFLAMQIIFFGQATTAYAVYLSGGMFGEAIKQFPSQSWRLVTPIFVHIGWQHAILNTLSLYFVGPLAERFFGSARFLLLYLLSGVMGNLFHLFFEPSVVAAGASTSLFGVFAAMAVLGYFGDNVYMQQLGRNYQMLIVINLFFNLFSPDVGMLGHIGGALGGALSAVFLPNDMVGKDIFEKSTRVKALLIYVGITILAYGLSIMF